MVMVSCHMRRRTVPDQSFNNNLSRMSGCVWMMKMAVKIATILPNLHRRPRNIPHTMIDAVSATTAPSDCAMKIASSEMSAVSINKILSHRLHKHFDAATNMGMRGAKNNPTALGYGNNPV